MKYFEAVFYYFLLPSRGAVEKVLFNHKAREEGTKDTKLKPCNSDRQLSELCDPDVKGHLCSLAPSLKQPTGAIAHSGPSVVNAFRLIQQPQYQNLPPVEENERGYNSVEKQERMYGFNSQNGYPIPSTMVKSFLL